MSGKLPYPLLLLHTSFRPTNQPNRRNQPANKHVPGTLHRTGVEDGDEGRGLHAEMAPRSDKGRKGKDWRKCAETRFGCEPAPTYRASAPLPPQREGGGEEEEGRPANKLNYQPTSWLNRPTCPPVDQPTNQSAKKKQPFSKSHAEGASCQPTETNQPRLTNQPTKLTQTTCQQPTSQRKNQRANQRINQQKSH